MEVLASDKAQKPPWQGPLDKAPKVYNKMYAVNVDAFRVLDKDGDGEVESHEVCCARACQAQLAFVPTAHHSMTSNIVVAPFARATCRRRSRSRPSHVSRRGPTTARSSQSLAVPSKWALPCPSRSR